eukprot:m.236587 g.236587  ORF g.236587 m.236587 type:complete len:134 (+) comp19350_c0_seq11:372-773(+)
MPPKKKKGGASEPTRFKIRVNTFHIGPGHREPVTCELVSTTPINKAKLLIEKAVSQELQISRGSLYFGQWQYYLMSNSSPDSVEHKVRRLDGGSITDIMWISRLGKVQNLTPILICVQVLVSSCHIVELCSVA